MGNLILKLLEGLAALLQWEYDRLLEKERLAEEQLKKVQAKAEDELERLREKAEEEAARIRRRRDEAQRNVEAKSSALQSKVGKKIERIRDSELIDFKVLNAIQPIVKKDK